jgi:hypothetical protein
MFPTTVPASLARPWLWLLGLLAATVLIYLPGLGGPFLFDDPPNLIVPIDAWLHGQTGWQEIVFGNASGLLGRPLSMLSFLANAAISGLDPLPFKATNLAIHLACGVLVYALLARLLPRDPQFGRHARLLALIVTALWLIHPMQVSTVLYVVQRMAQLGALFMLMGLLAYVHGRIAIEEGRTRAGRAFLFLALPAATLAAILSKENGALLPLLCAVIELGYFRASVQAPRPRSVKLFFCTFLLAPGALVAGWLALHPQRLLGAYVDRTFTFGERLLSEPRALMDYMGALLLPRGRALGLNTDDFAISHGLLDPPSTLFAILGLLALIVVALRARRRLPMFFTGIAFYLAAHVMESSVFALELYFEHRNYLPSAGFFLALVALAGWLITRALPHVGNLPRTRLWLNLGGGALFAVLGLATLVRASVWSSFPLLAAQDASQHPQSMRAQMDYANTLQKQGKYDEVQRVFDHVATIDNPAAPHVAAIDTVALQCMVHGEASPEAVARVAAIAGDRLQQFEMLAFENLANYLEKHECRNLTKAQLAATIVAVVDAAPQPATLVQLWRSRFVAAKLYVQAGQPAQAQTQLALAWKTGAADPAVGVFLATVYALNHDFANARLILDDVRKHLASWDRRGNTLVADLERQLDNASRAAAPTATDADTHRAIQ